MLDRFTRYAGALLVAATLSLGPTAGWTMGGSDDEWSPSDDDATASGSGDYERGVAEANKGNYAAAITAFKTVTASDPRNADALNMLGYSHRKIGQFDQSMAYYRQALTVDPNHRGALEYQGELFLQLGDPAMAKRNLTRLDRLCPRGCPEQADLKAAIDAHHAGREPEETKTW